MSDRPDIVFAPLGAETETTCVILAGEELSFGTRGRDLNTRSGGKVLKAAEAADFKGKLRASVELLAPQKLDQTRLIVMGVGKSADHAENDWTQLGGAILGQIASRKATSASIIAEVADAGDTDAADYAAWIACGALLRHYTFDKYLTRKGKSAENGEGDAQRGSLAKIVIHCAEPDKARTQFARSKAVANGVFLARDLVNEPANVLGPVEFADRVKELEQVGRRSRNPRRRCLIGLKMGALLAVGTGQRASGRVAVMQWHGAKSKRAKPLASSARASSSIRAASRSSPRPAWRT